MGRWVLQFDLAMLAVALLPLALTWSGFTGPVLGRRARRRRVVNGVIIVFLALLMLIGPENVQAMHVEHMMYQVLGPASLGATTTTKTVTYGYDANGNQTSVSDGTNTNFYVYDAENRLVKAEVNIDSPNTVTTYTYDADGTRLSKTVLKRTPTPEVTRTHYLVDKNAPLAQMVAEIDESGAVKVKYVHGDELISQTRDPNGASPITRYYHYDGQMSTRHLTNDPPDPQTTSAQVTDSYTYEAFGTLRPDSSDPENAGFLYTGQQLDPNTGFYYLRARYYNPAAGRFISQDTFEGLQNDPITLHRYVYAAAQPVTYQDPSGAFPSLLGTVGVVSILLIVMSFPNVANAPDVGDRLYGDAGGAMMMGAATSLLIAPPLCVLGRYVVSPVWNWLKVSVGRGRASNNVAALAGGELPSITKPPGPAGITVPRRLTPTEMADLTTAHNVEFALVYKVGPGRNGGGGQYILYSGTRSRVPVPIEGDTYLIYHTHPGGNLYPSGPDLNFMYFLQRAQDKAGRPIQNSSTIVPIGRDPKAFTVPRPPEAKP